MADMDAKVGTKNEDFESLWANKTREWNEEINKALTETGTTITGHQTVQEEMDWRQLFESH